MNQIDVPGRIAIYQDRYNGTYSGGSWLAVAERWDGPETLVESNAFGGDSECHFFWAKSPAKLRIGIGQTPNDALADLARLWKSNAEPIEFYWDEIVRMHQAGYPPTEEKS